MTGFGPIWSNLGPGGDGAGHPKACAPLCLGVPWLAAALCWSTSAMPGPSETLPVLEQRLAQRLLDFERLDAAWPLSRLAHVAMQNGRG